MEGLKLALKDPKVFMFSIMTVSQLLGLSFVQFFPTCVVFWENDIVEGSDLCFFIA